MTSETTVVIIPMRFHVEQAVLSKITIVIKDGETLRDQIMQIGFEYKECLKESKPNLRLITPQELARSVEYLSIDCLFSTADE